MFRQHRFHLCSPTILVQTCQQLQQFMGYKVYHRNNLKDDVVDETGDRRRNKKHTGRIECDFQLYKSKGQHLLTNTRVLDSIVKKSDIKATDIVLEIGPGTGNLTLRLLEAAHKVVAVEIDGRMAEALQKRVADCGAEDRLTLIHRDVLKTDFPEFDLVVANIPYGISSPLIAKLLFGTWSFRTATLVLQKEFARRLVAKPGDSVFNRLAVNVKLVADVELIMDVSKRDFFPVPKVDSSVVIIRPKVNVPNVDLSEWCAFTRTCFGKKNKTLGATFKQKKKLVELLRISELMGSEDDTLTFQNDFKNVNEHINEDVDVDVAAHDDDDDDDDDEIDVNTDPNTLPFSVTKMTLFKEKVIGILRCSRFEDKRPSKLSVEEILHLLSLFNQNKIYFHDKKHGSITELSASFEM